MFIKMLYFLSVCFILNGVFGTALDKQLKRLLLHSEMDIATEISNLKTQLNAQASEITTLKQQLQSYEHLKLASGSGSYIIWGRTICPGNGSTVLYTGYMSGTYLPGHLQSGKGSGANFLCLPDNPSWDHYTNTKDNSISVTGVEYNFYPHTPAEQVPFFGSAVGGGDAPCVTCQTVRGSIIMIPGRTECYDGWTKEYNGYLVAGYPGYAESSEFVCLDRRPEIISHSGNQVQENNLYFVESHCGGTLTCPPYVDGRELTCVVCSK